MMLCASRKLLCRSVGGRLGRKACFFHRQNRLGIRCIGARANQHNLLSIGLADSSEVDIDDPFDSNLQAHGSQALKERGLPTEASILNVLATIKINRLIQDACYDEALDVFREMDHPDTSLYAAALTACMEALLHEEACRIWAAMQPVHKTTASYTSMIYLCAHLQKLKMAEELMEEMRTVAVEPSASIYTSMIDLYSRIGSLDKAILAFRHAQITIIPSAHRADKQTVFLAVMHATSRVGDFNRTEEFLVEMVREGIPPNNLHFRALLTACLSTNTKIARAVFQRMFEYSLRPHVEEYLILLRCCRYELRSCLEVYSELEHAGIAPNGDVYQLLAEAYIIAGDARGARKFLLKAADIDHESERMNQLWEQVDNLLV